MANHYRHSSLPTNLDADQWQGWLKQHGWIQDANPRLNDIILLDDNKGGAGPTGAVGIIEHSIGNTPYRTLRMRTTNWPGEPAFADAGSNCTNVTNHVFKKLYDGHDGGVSYYFKPGVTN